MLTTHVWNFIQYQKILTQSHTNRCVNNSYNRNCTDHNLSIQNQQCQQKYMYLLWNVQNTDVNTKTNYRHLINHETTKLRKYLYTKSKTSFTEHGNRLQCKPGSYGKKTFTTPFEMIRSHQQLGTIGNSNRTHITITTKLCI